MVLFETIFLHVFGTCKFFSESPESRSDSFVRGVPLFPLFPPTDIVCLIILQRAVCGFVGGSPWKDRLCIISFCRQGQTAGFPQGYAEG